MAQRRIRDNVFGLIADRDDEDPHPIDERVLERIKFGVSEWDRMNWYVAVANMNFDKLTEGELLSLKEEFWAVKHTMLLGFEKPEPELNEIKVIQRNVALHLSELADQGKTTFGAFSLKVHVTCPVVEAKDMYREMEPAVLSLLHGGYHQTELVSGSGFIYYMTQLLQQFGGSIRRCPHCSRIFLQARKNAVYCTRKCQSVAVMRRKREVEKGSLKGRKSRSRQRRSQHGKTRR